MMPLPSPETFITFIIFNGDPSASKPAPRHPLPPHRLPAILSRPTGFLLPAPTPPDQKPLSCRSTGEGFGVRVV